MTLTLDPNLRYYFRLLFSGMCSSCSNYEVLGQVIAAGRRQVVLFLVYKSLSLFQSHKLRKVEKKFLTMMVDTILGSPHQYLKGNSSEPVKFVEIEVDSMVEISTIWGENQAFPRPRSVNVPRVMVLW